MIYKKRNKLKTVALAALCILSLAFMSYIPGVSSFVSYGAGGGSGLIRQGYTVYARDSNRVLSEVFSGDRIRIDARLSIPESITIEGNITGRVTGGGFDGDITNIAKNDAQRTVTVTFELTYTGGRSTNLMYNLDYTRSIGGGAAAAFNDSQSVNIGECIPDDDGGAAYIPPSGPSEPPRFEVDISARFPTANAGQTYVFEIPVKNVGKQAANNIVVSIDPGGDAPGFPFEYDKYAFTARMGELSINAVRNARFEVRVLPTARNGQHTIKVNFSGRTVLGVGSLSESSETIIITVNNTNTAPKLSLERFNLYGAGAGAAATAASGAAQDGGVINVARGAPLPISSVEPGTDFTLSVDVKNTGSLPAKDVSLAIRGLTAGGISTNNSPSVRYVSRINGDASATQTFELSCAEGITGDRTELNLSISYTDETGKEYSVESQLFIPLNKTKTSSGTQYTSFEITGISAPGGELREGANFNISFNIVNTGEVAMENIKLTCTAGTAFIAKSLNIRMLKPIPAGGSAPVSFDFTVSNNITSGNVPIEFNVEYTPGVEDDSAAGGGQTAGGGQAAARISASQYVGVQLFKPEETTTTTESTTTEGKESVPKIIISNYDYSPKEAKAGQTVDISLTYFNTSMTQTVKNIKIQIESDTEASGGYGATSGGVFTPVEGSSSFYIEQIGPRQEISRAIKMMIKGDADAKSYQLYSNIEYEDGKSNPITTKESISIPVSQVTKVTINDIMISSPGVMQYQPFTVSYTFINMGKTTLYNVMASVEGPFTSPAQGYYAGNMQPGAQDFYDVMMSAESGGELVGYALLTYEDAVGNMHEERMEFPFYVMEMPDYGDEMYDRGEMGFPDFGMDADYPHYGDEGAGGFMGFITGLPGSAMETVSRLLNEARRLMDDDPWMLIIPVAGAIILLIVIVSLAKRSKHKKLERELNRLAESELDAIDAEGGGPDGRGGGGSDQDRRGGGSGTRPRGGKTDVNSGNGAAGDADGFDGNGAVGDTDGFDVDGGEGLDGDTGDDPDGPPAGLSRLMAALEERDRGSGGSGN